MCLHRLMTALLLLTRITSTRHRFGVQCTPIVQLEVRNGLCINLLTEYHGLYALYLKATSPCISWGRRIRILTDRARICNATITPYPKNTKVSYKIPKNRLFSFSFWLYHLLCLLYSIQRGRQ